MRMWRALQVRSEPGDKKVQKKEVSCCKLGNTTCEVISSYVLA